MEARRILMCVTLTLCCVTWVTAEPATTYTTVTNKADSYWNTGNEVAVYLIAVPLLLIPLILIGLKLAQYGGEYGKADGHYHGNDHYKRAFKALSNSVLNHLTTRVLEAIKE